VAAIWNEVQSASQVGIRLAWVTGAYGLLVAAIALKWPRLSEQHINLLVIISDPLQHCC
jgi:hypothetical protein